jgi:tetratricopeptide (TPR) repeat protein
MTSHIFIAMGMWDDVIDANVRAMAVVDKHRAAIGKRPLRCGHYATWLHYALLQKHRVEDARTMLDQCRSDAFGPPIKGGGNGLMTEETRFSAYADMVASQAMSGVPLTDADRAAPPEEFIAPRFTLAYAEAFDAYRRGDSGALAEAATRLHALQKAKEGESHAGYMEPGMNMNPNKPPRMAVVIEEVNAMQLAAAGKREEAVAALRKAAAAEQAIPFEFGPPFIEKPTLELLGDQLLAMKRAGEAAEAYRAALARTPGRTAASEGLSQSQRR